MLLFDDNDLEAQTGVKREEDIGDELSKANKADSLTSPEDTVSQSEASMAGESSTRRQTEDEENEEKERVLNESEAERFQKKLL